MLAALASAVVREGQIVSVETHGAPDGTVFRMASLSKVVTAYAVLQLARERRVDLHADIGRYVPVEMHRYRGAKVTLHHLLTHTSGIEDAFFGNTVPLARRVPTLEEHFRARPPTFSRPPGAQVIYSNEGIALAGLVVERVSGLPFAEYVRRRIFEPLGMHRSSFAQPPPFDVFPSGAEGEALLLSPSGVMVSTAEDMAKLMIALLRDVPEYGLFDDPRGGRFHTGRSGHESVLYLAPEQRLGVFLVHTGGMDRTLRRRFVDSIVGPRTVAPGGDDIPSGTYRALLFPLKRVERVLELGADARLTDRSLRLPPFALGKSITIGTDGFRITGDRDRFILTGPLFDPVTFERIPWWASGRAQLAALAVALLVVLSAIFRVRGRRRVLFALFLTLLVAAPVAFLANYLPRDAATRPFVVERSVDIAVLILRLAAIVALATPFARAERARKHAHVAAAAAIGIAALLWRWNLLG